MSDPAYLKHMSRKRQAPPFQPELLRKDHPAYALERYTPSQAALYLGMSRASVYRELAEERLAHRRNGTRGTVVMSQADLDEWRERNRKPARISPAQLRAVVRRDAPAASGLQLPRKRMFG